MEKKTFYRVANTETGQGLWYDQQGNFTGLIHSEFNFCLHKDLKMDFDPELSGYLSATDSLEDLHKWFPKEDIKRLQDFGYSIHVYESADYKFYERFQHLVINQESAVLINKLTLHVIEDEIFHVEDLII